MTPEQAAQTTTPVVETMLNHVTIRHFTDDLIPAPMLDKILAAGRRASTSSNRQTYSIIVVRDPEVKKELAVLAGGQKHVEVCPVFLAFCADIRRIEVGVNMHDTQMYRTLETSLVSTVDAALVGQNVLTAAESFGLGGVMIGGMRNHPQKVADLLGFPKGVYVVYGMCLGWPDPDMIPAQKPRLPEEVIIFQEKYDSSDPTPYLEQYDRELAAHYETQGRNLDTAAWTGVLAKGLGQPRRPELAQTLTDMGFQFD